MYHTQRTYLLQNKLVKKRDINKDETLFPIKVNRQKVKSTANRNRNLLSSSSPFVNLKKQINLKPSYKNSVQSLALTKSFKKELFNQSHDLGSQTNLQNNPYSRPLNLFLKLNSTNKPFLKKSLQNSARNKFMELTSDRVAQVKSINRDSSQQIRKFLECQRQIQNKKRPFVKSTKVWHRYITKKTSQSQRQNTDTDQLIKQFRKSTLNNFMIDQTIQNNEEKKEENKKPEPIKPIIDLFPIDLNDYKQKPLQKSSFIQIIEPQKIKQTKTKEIKKQTSQIKKIFSSGINKTDLNDQFISATEQIPVSKISTEIELFAAKLKHTPMKHSQVRRIVQQVNKPSEPIKASVPVKAHLQTNQKSIKSSQPLMKRTQSKEHFQAFDDLSSGQQDILQIIDLQKQKPKIPSSSLIESTHIQKVQNKLGQTKKQINNITSIKVTQPKEPVQVQKPKTNTNIPKQQIKQTIFKQIPKQVTPPPIKSVQKQQNKQETQQQYEDDIYLDYIEKHLDMIDLFGEYHKVAKQSYASIEYPWQINSFWLYKKFAYERERILVALKGGFNCFTLQGLTIEDNKLSQLIQLDEIQEYVSQLQEEANQIKSGLIQRNKKACEINPKLKSAMDLAIDPYFEVIKYLGQQFTFLSKIVQTQNQNKGVHQRLVYVCELIFIIQNIHGNFIKQWQQMNSEPDVQPYKRYLAKYKTTIEKILKNNKQNK